MAKKPTLGALLFLISFLSLSSASATSDQPQEHSSFKPQEPQQVSQIGGGCSYTVKIKTSCSSPRYTRDMISVAFGDVYRNEVYAPRLDDPSTRAFERCSTDTFKMQGPCGYGVCYLYVRRDGWDGWVPDWVQIYETSYRRSVTFYYGAPIPNGVWYGFNHCHHIASASSAIKSTVGGKDDLISH